MDYSVDNKLISLLNPDEEGIIVVTPDNQYLNNPNLNNKLLKVIDILGNLSAKAQGLKSTITNSSKFISSDHILYLKLDGNKIIGFLKTGFKKLFFWDEMNRIKELFPLCILDFYVHEDYQRNGFGKLLFKKMINWEGFLPEKIAYDRPSDKLIKFLKKHYNLIDYIPQNNNYVIFNEYFLNNEDSKFKKDINKPKNKTLNSNNSMIHFNVNTYNEFEIKKLPPKSKIMNDYSPIRGGRNFSKFVNSYSNKKNDNLNKSESKIQNNDYEEEDDERSNYKNHNEKSKFRHKNKPESNLYFNKYEVSEPNNLNKENKNFYYQYINDRNSILKGETENNSTTASKGISSNKKNFSTITLTHVDYSKENFHEIKKNKILSVDGLNDDNNYSKKPKNEFVPSSSSYGAYFKLRK